MNEILYGSKKLDISGDYAISSNLEDNVARDSIKDIQVEISSIKRQLRKPRRKYVICRNSRWRKC